MIAKWSTPYLTRFAGSCSQHLMAPSIFFLMLLVLEQIIKFFRATWYTHTFHASLSMPQKRTQLYRLYSQGNLANALTCSMVVQRIWIRLVFHFKTFSISSLEYHPISKSLTVLSFFVRDFSLNLMNASWIRLALDLFGLLIWVARPTWRVNWQNMQ